MSCGYCGCKCLLSTAGWVIAHLLLWHSFSRSLCVRRVPWNDLRSQGWRMNSIFSPAEDELLALGMYRFGPLDMPNVALQLLPCKSPEQLSMRYEHSHPVFHFPRCIESYRSPMCLHSVPSAAT